ncbi:hypothetical protein [Nocardia cyriacigeorgica]|uniref:hypothetical protein n=1 Tax=Nocardia cyriacigeorgica TaxID=135487 RepID=UPI001895D1CE|nr:hypothetical protein [Nocardia cyriacigeorgica]MBF6455166.1 hypothetical protein [Nocardia cyriacigeorgica]MBF6554092.1 hypothetical protein [Nocardia cyriacigeorgica]
MRSNRVFDDRLKALDKAADGLLALDLTQASDADLDELQRRVESRTRHLAGFVVRVVAHRRRPGDREE